MEERRRNKRLGLKAIIVMKRLDSDEKKEVAIELEDVSRTGAGFKCTEVLQIGAVYETHLTLWTKEIIHSFIEIVRIEKVTDSFLYGAIFVGMAEVDSQRIMIYETIENQRDMGNLD